MPQIRTRQPQIASMLANAESVKPDVPQPPLPDIKSKQKYIAAQQPTQVTPVQASPQQAAQQAGKKAVRGERKLCQPSLANETVPVPTSRNVAPTKPARVQKQARPAVVRKQKIKTAPNQIRHTCCKSPAQQSVGGCSQAGRNCPPQRAGASGYGDQNGEGSKRGWKESPACNCGSGRKAGRSDWCRRCGGSFRCRGDLACRDVVCFAARYPVRR